MEQNITHRPLTDEEMVEFKAEMDALVEKFNVDIQVESKIIILKREETPSPYGETTDTQTEESSTGGDKEPSE